MFVYTLVLDLELVENSLLSLSLSLSRSLAPYPNIHVFCARIDSDFNTPETLQELEPFNSLGITFVQMYCFFTGSNTPDMFATILYSSFWHSIFWFPMAAVLSLFVRELVLAIVQTEYGDVVTHALTLAERHAYSKFEEAFDVLTDGVKTKALSKDDYETLVRHIEVLSGDDESIHDRWNIVWYAVQLDSNMKDLTHDEWMELCRLYCTHIHLKPDKVSGM